MSDNQSTFSENNYEQFYDYQESHINLYQNPNNLRIGMRESDVELNTFNFICEKCYSVTQIIKIGIENYKIYLKCECLCYIIEDITIEDFYKEFEKTKIIKIKNIKIFSNSFCNIHKKAKYELYCKDCHQDLCPDCIGEDHINHDLFYFNNNYIKKIIEKTKEINNEKNNNNNNNLKYTKELLKHLIDIYEDSPCYNIYSNIINVYNFYEDNKNTLNENISNIIINIKERKIKKKIRFPRELKENSNNGEKIAKIYICKKGFDHFDEMMLKDMSELEVLVLADNNISSIKPLIKKEFPKLTHLNLGKNRLGDENIEYIKNLKAPELNQLNLFENNLTKNEIFESIKHFNNLKEFFIGTNKINFNKNFDEKYYEFPTFERIGLGFGVFSNESIQYLSHIKMEKLKDLYLNANNLNSIQFIEKLTFTELEAIHFMNNFIKDFEPLIKFKDNFKTINKINLKNNMISDITNLEKLVEAYPNLKHLNLSENKIDLNNKDNKEIINKIIKRKIVIEIY